MFEFNSIRVGEKRINKINAEGHSTGWEGYLTMVGNVKEQAYSFQEYYPLCFNVKTIHIKYTT